MPSKLQSIMTHLNPRVIIAKCMTPHDNARQKYVLQSSIVLSYGDYEKEIISYMEYHMKEVFSYAFPPDYLLGKAEGFLQQIGGPEKAVYIALSGVDGGMGFILNQLAEGFKQEAKRNYMEYVINTFISPLSFEECLEVMTELKNALIGYSPQPFNYVSPEEMVRNYKSILYSYVENLTHQKNLWAY